MILYDYFRSTACYRVRIALHVKQVAFESIEVHLVNDGGQHNSPEYRDINPQGLVPSLKVHGQVLHQSLAIIDYLDETITAPPLLHEDPLIKATIRSLALIIACDMHPLNNMRVLNRIRSQFDAQESEVMRWYHHWLKTGFDGFEAELRRLDREAPFCVGDRISLADVCLIPQVYNAHRFHFAMDNYPLINEINAHCLSLPAFQKSIPKAE